MHEHNNTLKNYLDGLMSHLFITFGSKNDRKQSVLRSFLFLHNHPLSSMCFFPGGFILRLKKASSNIIKIIRIGSYTCISETCLLILDAEVNKVVAMSKTLTTTDYHEGVLKIRSAHIKRRLRSFNSRRTICTDITVL